MAAPSGIGEASGPVGQSAAAAPGGVGTDIRGPDSLSAAVREDPPAQAGRRSDPAASPHHRARNGLPLPALTNSGVIMIDLPPRLQPRAPGSPRPAEQANPRLGAARPGDEQHGWP